MKSLFKPLLVLTVVFASVTLFSCTEDTPEPEPPMFFPDPDFDNTYYDALIIGNWEVDSVIDLTWDKESNAQTRKTTKYNIPGAFGYHINYKANDSYIISKSGSTSEGEYVYDHRSLRVEEFYDSQRAALVNVSTKELTFCYNVTFGNSIEKRRLYYLTRK
jgi:hypothetical protein